MNILRRDLLRTETAPKTLWPAGKPFESGEMLIRKLNSMTDSKKPLERQGKDPTFHICISHLGNVYHYINIGRNPEIAGRKATLNLKKVKDRRLFTSWTKGEKNVSTVLLRTEELNSQLQKYFQVLFRKEDAGIWWLLAKTSSLFWYSKPASRTFCNSWETAFIF